MTMPSSVRAGVTTEVSYSASSDAVAVAMVANFAGTVETISAAEQADGTWLLTFPQTTDYAAGRYSYVVYEVDSDGTKTTIGSGAFAMLPSLASGDPRTNAEKILDAINAVIEGRATKNQARVRVGDKDITYMTIAELISAKAVYEDIVASEQDAISGVNRQTYYAEFVRP